MKQIARYVLTAAVMLASAIGTQAQTDPEVTIKAIEKIVKIHDNNADLFIHKEIYPKYRKDAKMLTGIARAYSLHSGADSSYIFNYLRNALEVNPNYAPAYIVGGTEYMFRKDTVAAFAWYDRAITLEPKAPEGYLAYARLMANKKYSKYDLEGAVRKLEELANVNPGANVYVEIGRLYVDATDLQAGIDYTNQAIDAYSKADVTLMTPGQVEGYVRLLQGAGAAGAGLGAYNRSDSILSLVLTKYPTNADLNRLMLQNSVKLERYEQALTAADALFNKSDSLEIDFTDFINYGDAYLGLKRYDDAVEMYRKCVDYEVKRSDYKSDEAFENMKRREDRRKGDAMKKIVAAYEKKGYPELAIEEYEKYMAYRRALGKLSSSDVNELAELYTRQADFMNGAEKVAAYRKAFDAYDEMAKVAFTEDGMEDNALIAYAQRISIASQVLDREQTEGLGISDAEEIIRLCPIDIELSGLQMRCLKLSVRFLAYYYLQKDQYKQLSKYYRMLEKIAPDDNLYVTLSNNKVYRRKMGIR